MKLPIYMDHHATTPVDPRVVEAMAPYFTQVFGNASSRNHVFGWEAEAAVDEARSQIAAAINADPKEIVFTSGATESDNLAVIGAARAYRSKGDHVVTATTEHSAVLDSCRALEREGFRVTYLEPERDGSIVPETVARGARGEDRPRLSHARQQRDRRRAGHRRHRRGLPREGRPLPHRRRSVLLQNPLRCRGDACRPGLSDGAQALWPQGCRGSLRARPRSPRPHRAADARRRPRARDALGHAERAGHRGLREGGRSRAWLPARRKPAGSGSCAGGSPTASSPESTASR